MKLNFEALVEALRADGYEVDVKIENNPGTLQYEFASVSGKGIVAGFCKENPDIHPKLSNRIAADNEECFDKWSTVPLVMELPVDYEILKTNLEHLASPEGFDVSNSYSYVENNPYPYEVKEKDVV